MAEVETNPIQISVINASTTVTDDEVRRVVDALQLQVSADFAPVWRHSATLSVLPKGSSIPAKAWSLSVMDESDRRSALGYHLRSPEGSPYARVFAGTAMRYGKPWSVVASHELLEMLVNPNADSTVALQSGEQPRAIYLREVCDPCEPSKFGYRISGVLVSDFVYPTWFEAFRQENSAQFDHRKQIRRPFQVCPGGYISLAVPTGASKQRVR